MSEPVYQLWRYNNWANQLLLKEFIKQEEAIPATCVHLLSHIINAQMIWLSRIKGDQPAVSVWEDHSILECERYHSMFSDAIQQELANYNEKEQKTIQYTNTNKVSFDSTLLDIFLQIFNHGTYHRAQIAMEMRRHGFTPVNTDYITFVRS